MIHEPNLLPTPFFRRRHKNYWREFDRDWAVQLPHVEVAGVPEAQPWDESRAGEVRASWTTIAVLRVLHPHRTSPRIKIGFLNEGTCQILDRPFRLGADDKYGMTLGHEPVTFFAWPYAGYDVTRLELFTQTTLDDPRWSDLHYI